MKTSSNTKRQTSSEPEQRFVARWFWWIVTLCVMTQSVLAIDCARRWTPTHDEYWHLPIGLRIWTTGRFDEDVINPPLVRLWAAVPLVIGGANTGDDNFCKEVGTIGNRFWDANGDRVRFWFFLGRLMLIPSAAVTGFVIAHWGRAWYDERTAVVAVLLWSCCPTGLANSAIVTHDSPLAAAWMLTLWMFVRFAEKPSWRRSVPFGAALGIAILCKLTAVILVPLTVLLWFVLRFPAPSGSTIVDRSEDPNLSRAAPTLTVSRAQCFIDWGAALLVAVLVINACYLFRGSGASFGSLHFDSGQLKAIRDTVPWLGGIPIPFPTDFVAAFDRLSLDLERLHPVYLDSNWSDRPVLWYYFAALAYKLPLATLALIPFGFVDLFWPRPATSDRHHALFLLIAALLLPVLAGNSGNQIGIRYILPSLPILCLFASPASRWLDAPRLLTFFNITVCRVIWVLIMAAPLSLRFHPHHLAYFNGLAGGPENGAWHLVDSNIDWGQDLHALRDYLDQKKLNDIGLAYFGTVLPESIGINAHDPPMNMPQPGWYAISVNFVHGRPHEFRNHENSTVRINMGDLAYFRVFEPVTSIGYSINIYHLTHRDVDRFQKELRAQQGLP